MRLRTFSTIKSHINMKQDCQSLHKHAHIYINACFLLSYSQLAIIKYLGLIILSMQYNTIKVYRGDFQGTPTLVRAPRAQAKKIENKNLGFFPRYLPT